MSLATLQNKAPKEVLSLLSAISTSLLPNPNVDTSAIQQNIDKKTIESVIKEIRHRLNIPDDDYSISAQSKIFDFLSKEISNVALSDENIIKIRKRLGGKGELPLREYNVGFRKSFTTVSEILGEKKSNVSGILENHDRFLHINPKYVMLDDYSSLRITLFTKLVTPKKIQDKFIQIVIAVRSADSLSISNIFRAYFSEIKLDDLVDPLDILKAFVNTYGLTFRFGNLTSKFIQNDVAELRDIPSPLDIKVLDGQKGNFYTFVMVANESEMSGRNLHSSKLSEIILAFAIDVSRYSAALEKHNVPVSFGERDFFRIK